MGFSQTFINFTKTLYKDNTSTITNNGYFSYPVQIQRGLRQDYQLSLPVCVVQGEITTTNINQDKNIKGIKIPNYTKQIKLSEYADDSNFLLTEQKSAEKVMNFLKNFTKPQEQL